MEARAVSWTRARMASASMVGVGAGKSNLLAPAAVGDLGDRLAEISRTRCCGDGYLDRDGSWRCGASVALFRVDASRSERLLPAAASSDGVAASAASAAVDASSDDDVAHR